MTHSPRILAYGDAAILVHWEVEGFDAAVSDAVHALAAKLRGREVFTDIVPGYDSLVATFDTARLPLASAKRRVEDALLRMSPDAASETGTLHDIPVHYGGENGPDLATLAEAKGLSEAGVIERHAAQTYRVCMMGFIPGFAFLSAVDPALAHPRHATPRAHVPAGSVGIANWQTGIYGLASPGGWQIIGRTESVMFDASRPTPFLLSAGDRIRFVPS